MWSLKKLRATDRPMTSPLFLLRCVQLGISIRDLDLLTIGMVNDMYAESGNDEYKGYAQIATQSDLASIVIQDSIPAILDKCKS